MNARATSLHGLLAATIALPLAAMIGIGWLEWDATWRRAERELIRTADAAGEYGTRILEGASLATDRVDDLIRGLSDDEVRERQSALHAEIARLTDELALIRTVVVFDRDGRVLLSGLTTPAPGGVASADREWMSALRGSDAPLRHVSRVYRGRLDGSLFFGVSRRRSTGVIPPSADGFRGVVSASVDPNRMAAGFGDLASHAEDVFTFVRADGHILARRPGFSEPPGQVPTTLFQAALDASEARTVYRVASRIDGIERLTALRRLTPYPVYVGVGRSVNTIAADWRAAVLRQLAFGLPAMAALIAVTLFAIRRSRSAEDARVALAAETARREVAEAATRAESRFRAVFDSRVLGKAIFDLVSDRTLEVNDRFLELTGRRRDEVAALPWDWRDATPVEFHAGDAAALAQARAQGSWDPIEKEYLHPDGSRVPVRIHSAPLPGEPGRLVIAAQDISAQRAAEARRDLLMREVEHRAKNVFATVQASLRLGAASAANPREFAAAAEARIAALARAQSLLSAQRWEGVELRALLQSECDAFIGEGAGATVASATLDGQSIVLAPAAAQPLCMAIHELATNALKYGALSRPDGSLSVVWRVLADGRLRILWVERGGPSVTQPPPQTGFGSRMLEAAIREQLRGTIENRWERDGLVCVLTLPLDQLTAGTTPSDSLRQASN